MDVDVERLFDTARTPLETIHRVDQTWGNIWMGGGEAVERYVQAAEAVVSAVCTSFDQVAGVKMPTTPAVDLESDLIARVVVVPLGAPYESAGSSIVAAAIKNLGFAQGVEIGGIIGLPHFPEIGEWSPPPASSHHQTWSTAELLAAISRVLADQRPIDRIRRVLGPVNDVTLSKWLGVSRPTLREWEQAVPEGTTKAARLRSVGSIADLLEQHIDPRELSRYVHDVPIEAADGQTIAAFLAEAKTPRLNAFRDELADALSW